MSFLFPGAFWLLALLPVLALLYFFRKQRRKQVISSIMLWKSTIERKPARKWFRNFRRLLSFLLNALILLLLILALARPWSGDSEDTGAIIAIVDSGLNMQAGDADGTMAFDRAREHLLGVVANKPQGVQMAIVEASGRRHLAAAPSADRYTLREQIQSLRVTDAAADPEECFDLAGRLADLAGAKSTVHVLTNQPWRWQNEDPRTRIIDFSGDADHSNIAIVSFDARRNLVDPLTIDVYANVASFSGDPVDTELEIFLNGDLFDVRPVELRGGESGGDAFQVAPDGVSQNEIVLEARLTGEDALPTDNRAFAVVPPASKARLLVLGDGNWFLENLLAADRSVEYELLSQASFREGMEAGFDVLVLDEPDENLLALALTLDSNVLVFGREDDGDENTGHLVGKIDYGHPVMRMVGFDRVRIYGRGSGLPALEGWEVRQLVSGIDQSTLVLAANKDERRLVFFGFPLLESDLVLRAAFPIMIGNAVSWLNSPRPETMSTLQAGSDILLGDGESITPKGGARQEGVAKSLLVSLDRAGIFTIDGPEGTRKTAVNPSAHTVADLRGPPDFASADGEGDGVMPSAPGTPIWVWLLVAAMVLSLLEWYSFHRRRTE